MAVFDKQTADRLVEQLLHGESQPISSGSVEIPKEIQSRELTRFKLLTEVTQHRYALGRRLIPEKRRIFSSEAFGINDNVDRSKYQMIAYTQSSEVSLVYLGTSSLLNYLPKYSEVNCIETPFGWEVINADIGVLIDTIQGDENDKIYDERFPNGFFSYMCVYASMNVEQGIFQGLFAGVETDYLSDGNVNNSGVLSDEAGVDLSRLNWFVTSSQPVSRSGVDIDPDTGPRPNIDYGDRQQLVDFNKKSKENEGPRYEFSLKDRTGAWFICPTATPITNQPVIVSYADIIEEDYPKAILDFLAPEDESEGATGKNRFVPRSGQLWAPTNAGKVGRNATALELWWYEWIMPEPECVTITVSENNPDYDPKANVCNPTHNDYDPTNSVCESSITTEKDVWGLPGGCNFPDTARFFFDEDGEPIPCTDPAPTRRSVFWIAPNGGDYFGSWNYSWFYNTSYGWRYPWSYGGVGSNWYKGWRSSFQWGWYGGWGYWADYWGGRSPSPEELKTIAESDDPEPPCGEIVRRKRYGFIIWEQGWRVIGTSNVKNSIGGPTCVVQASQFRYNRELISDIDTDGVPSTEPPDPTYGESVNT